MLADRWGVTDAEVTRRYPCDTLVPSPALAAWRGVSVAAPPDGVWPWVGQIRLAPYSYDWIDNLGRRSPRELHGLPEPRVGEAFTAVAGRRTGTILAVDPGRALTGRIMGAVMSYVLVPAPGESIRLVLKVVTAGGPRPLLALLSAGDLVMARRQLLNLARLAEGGYSAS
ncbi:polyketide cyclase [Nocardioides acrostichi]|uniref:Polyketide cyclase n=1 Tax=Nocardioides acrostichi TaxID=2784339 RepID=A0A930V4B6_9ACTN|nr:polyketide cyclase [Nocardioides acrostichi]MBF4163754.1 polyketide cyclase [Nocardioides acrostichi]